MKKFSIILIITLALSLTSCDIMNELMGSTTESSTTTNIETQVAQTIAAQETATAMFLAAMNDLYRDQTATAAIEKAVSDALTAAAPPPSDTPTPSETPTDTPAVTDTPTETPSETPTETYTPSPTTQASATACFVVINDWCLTHEGCATMDIRNNTGAAATIRFWDPKTGLDKTFYPPPGQCSFMIKPGKYNYSFDYCGVHNEGSHALNDRWYIVFKCP